MEMFFQTPLLEWYLCIARLQQQQKMHLWSEKAHIICLNGGWNVGIRHAYASCKHMTHGWSGICFLWNCEENRPGPKLVHPETVAYDLPQRGNIAHCRPGLFKSTHVHIVLIQPGECKTACLSWPLVLLTRSQDEYFRIEAHSMQ